VQFATTADAARVIAGVEVTTRSSDLGETTPMLAQIAQRTGVRAAELLVDGGYTQHAGLDQAAEEWGGGRVAAAHGHRRGQGDLPAAGRHGGDRP
jgi:hypothetical protein